ncbi:MAG: hypothetical protein H0T17_08950 [Propionibacteriales bacterium]|nr:hypothetical protein [Propionibacteriales bacterium]
MNATPGLTFDEIARRALPRLVCAADLMTGDAATADEAVVDALALVHRQWTTVTNRREPLDSIRRALTTTSVRRHRSRVPPTQSSLQLADEHCHQRDPQTDLDRLWEALLDVSPRSRAVLVWRYFEQLSDRALARATGLPVLVTSRLARNAVEQVTLTVGPTGSDEICDARDSDELAGIESAIAECMALHHRGRVDVTALLERVQERVVGMTPRRSRGRAVLIAGVAALVIVSGALASVWAARDGPPTTAAPAPVHDTPAAPAGSRLVGFRTLAVAVPTGWGRNTGCGAHAHGSVVYPDADVEIADPGCDAAQTLSTVTFSGSASRPRMFGRANRTIGEADGQPVLATSVRRHAGVYVQRVLVPIAGFSMLVRSPDRAVLDSIVSSVQPVPGGYSVVPICRGQRLRDASADVVRAGLKPVIQQASTLSNKFPQPPVTYQSLDGGVIVPVGSEVGLSVPSF